MVDFYYFVLLAIAMCIYILWVYDRRTRKQYKAVTCTAYDGIAIDQSILVLHAYAQVGQKQPINFSKETIEAKFFVHLPKPDALWAGWSFYQIEGCTGLVDYGVKSKSMLGLVGVHEEKKIISFAFRNTRKVSDLVNAFQLTFDKNKKIGYPGYLHKGYSDVFNSCIPSLDRIIKALCEKIADIGSYDIVTTGHSLGGSLATLLAAYMVEHPMYTQVLDLKKMHLITFGAPYVGTKCGKYHFSRWLTQHIPYIKCFERTTDIVPLVTNVATLQIAPKSWWGYQWARKIQLVPPSPVPIELFHFHDSRFNFRRAHDICKYRYAVYKELGIPYQKIYLKEYSLARLFGRKPKQKK
ncbi:MAG: hypothetical protein AAF900_00645 [Bacteroidota bacterium]